jgi:hypothetical protein
MRDTTKLSTGAMIEKVWMANNSVMFHEHNSTLEATQQAVKILGAQYEKADLNTVAKENCSHPSVSDQENLPKLLTEFEDIFDGMLGVWDTEPPSLKLREGSKPYHDSIFPTPTTQKP